MNNPTTMEITAQTRAFAETGDFSFTDRNAVICEHFTSGSRGDSSSGFSISKTRFLVPYALLAGPSLRQGVTTAGAFCLWPILPAAQQELVNRVGCLAPCAHG
jgi:hypothetical protein